MRNVEHAGQDVGGSDLLNVVGGKTVIQALSSWASRGPGVLSTTAITNTRDAIGDVIACMFAGSTQPPALAVHRSIARWGNGAARVVGHGMSVPSPFAALVNGTSAHALDYDDVLIIGSNHPSAVLVPALLGIGEEIGCSGMELIDAYVVGLQLQYYLSLATMRSHGDVGWHPTSTIGAIGAAGACGRLLKLDQLAMSHALSLAISMVGGLKVQFGTNAKPLQAGLAAQHAVEAATLANAGMTGNIAAIEGPMGFMELYGGPHSAGWVDVLPRLDSTPLAMETPGLLTKRYPCCAATHRALDCILDLQEKHGIKAGDVASVETAIGYGFARNLRYEAPVNEMEARFSMQYCVAAAVYGHGLSLSDFTYDAVHRRELRPLMGNITVQSFDVTDSNRPHQVTIRLKNGRQFNAERDLPCGTLAFPMPAEVRRKKFFDCCGMLNEMQRERLWQQIEGLENLMSVRELSLSCHGDQ